MDKVIYFPARYRKNKLHNCWRIILAGNSALYKIALRARRKNVAHPTGLYKIALRARRKNVAHPTGLYKIAWISLLVIALPLHAGDKIYRYTDADGVLHLSSQPPPAQPPRTSAAAPSTVLHLHNEGGIAQISQRPYLEPEAAPQGVNHALLRAIIDVESNWNPSAVSPRGATGLMQLMPSTAAQYGAKNLHDPLENLQAGVQHIDYLMKKFNGNLRLVLAAYNAGEGAVKKYGGIPPYPETQGYVEKVLNLYHRYLGGD